MNSESAGIIYIATGQQFIDEACDSATSVKNCMPDIPITIFTDKPIRSPLFNQIVHVEKPHYGLKDKVVNIGKSPYRDTLYLDADTYVIDDVRDLFVLLETFDFAAAHSPFRSVYRVDGVPDCFPEVNAGVLVFRRSEKTRSLFERWVTYYNEDELKIQDWLFPGGANFYNGNLHDQPSLRRALYESDVRMAALPPEYNCRLPFPGYVHTKVKILHGRDKSMNKISAELNKTTIPRVHFMRWGKLQTLESAMPPGDGVLARLRWSLHHRGILKTAASFWSMLVCRPDLVMNAFKRLRLR